jgi:inorganic triphosphatase YgiF
MAKAGKIRGLKKRSTLAEAAARTLAVRLSEFEAHLPALDTPEDADALHDLRIAAKRLRYTVELFQDVLAPDAPELIERLKDLQDDLGYIHDRDVLAGLARDEHRAAADREAELLAGVATSPGPRHERLGAVAARLQGPEGVANLAPGLFGLLADATDERRARLARLHKRRQALQAGRFVERLRALTARTED